MDPTCSPIYFWLVSPFQLYIQTWAKMWSNIKIYYLSSGGCIQKLDFFKCSQFVHGSFNKARLPLDFTDCTQRLGEIPAAGSTKDITAYGKSK